MHYHLNNLLMEDCARGMKGKILLDACRTGLLNLLYAVGNVGKSGLHAGNMRSNTQNEDCIRIRKILCTYNFTCVFFYTS
jgi:hypothetical protein